MPENLSCPCCAQKRTLEKRVWYLVAGCVAFLIVAGTIFYSGEQPLVEVTATIAVLDFAILFGGVYHLATLIAKVEGEVSHSLACRRHHR